MTSTKKGSVYLFFVVGLNLVLASAFALQFSKLLNTSFDIREARILASHLSETNEKASLSLLSKNETSDIDVLAKSLDFKRAEKVEYINTLNRGVAAKAQ